MAAGITARAGDISQSQTAPRESGVLHSSALLLTRRAAGTFEFYAGMANDLPVRAAGSAHCGRRVRPHPARAGRRRGAIIPWNGPLGLISYKIASTLLAGESGRSSQPSLRELAEGDGHRGSGRIFV